MIFLASVCVRVFLRVNIMHGCMFDACGVYAYIHVSV